MPGRWLAFVDFSMDYQETIAEVLEFVKPLKFCCVLGKNIGDVLVGELEDVSSPSIRACEDPFEELAQ